jgi:hypothetical protein
MVLFKTARWGMKGFSADIFRPYFLNIADNLTDINVHRTATNTATTTGATYNTELLRHIQQLMIKALAEPGSLGSPRVISSGDAGEPGGLTAFPAPNPLNIVPVGIVPNVKAIAHRTDIGTKITMDAAICQPAPVGSFKNPAHRLHHPLSGDRSGGRSRGRCHR